MPKHFDVNAVLDGLDPDVYAGKPLPDEREFMDDDYDCEDVDYEDDSEGRDYGDDSEGRD